MLGKILVVDDEPDMLDLIAHNLRSAGYEVFTAQNGGEVLKRAPTVLPDLIILDLMMPDIDGFTVCEFLRRLPSTATIPVLMLTAMSGEIPRCHAFECGATDFLHKPFRPSDLVGRVQAALKAVGSKPPDENPEPPRYFLVKSHVRKGIASPSKPPVS